MALKCHLGKKEIVVAGIDAAGGVLYDFCIQGLYGTEGVDEIYAATFLAVEFPAVGRETGFFMPVNLLIHIFPTGGGQKGIRENPAFKGYEALWKAYMQGMNRILDTLPPEQIQEAAVPDIRPQTVLDTIRNKHNKP